jgi:hypothetical protein
VSASDGAAVCPGGAAAAEDVNPALGLWPSLTTMLVGLRRLLSPGDGGVRPLPQPVGQRLTVAFDDLALAI